MDTARPDPAGCLGFQAGAAHLAGAANLATPLRGTLPPMSDAPPALPVPRNEPVLSYAPGTAERASLRAALDAMAGETAEIPLTIGGARVETGALHEVRAPHAHPLLLARVHQGGPREVERAIEAASKAHAGWASLPWTERAAVFLRAADLLAGPWRARLNAATMLGQSKTVQQAEIDSACELVDFLRFNAWFAGRVQAEQPESAPGTRNVMEPRPLEGFVLAVTPFNFTAIAGNLPSAPALMGNTVVWKPAAAAMLSANLVLRLLEEAGLPPGVINLVTGEPEATVGAALAHRSLAGVHFTGSTTVFQAIWRKVGERIGGYATYPRLVGETGGKDFIVAHASADLDALAVACVRGAFEYQGQKCSAASRLYVPRSMWPALRERIVALVAEIRVGDVSDFRSFMGAVIDARAFARIGQYLALAKSDPGCRVVTGGAADDRDGFFVQPTVVEVDDPRHRLMCEEIFGPILTVFAYPDDGWDWVLGECDAATPYALTGAVFARDREAVEQASRRLRFAAGNFYVNDKPTGAVVGQQPFGGARASGTNDKAGSVYNLLRWTSPRVIKETFEPALSLGYPSMSEP